jgi:hypothetical protein
VETLREQVGALLHKSQEDMQNVKDQISETLFQL